MLCSWVCCSVVCASVGLGCLPGTGSFPLHRQELKQEQMTGPDGVRGTASGAGHCGLWPLLAFVAQLWHLDGERMALGKPPQNGCLHATSPLALGPLGRCRAVGAGNTGGMGMGPPLGWGCLLGTWLLHELVADLVGGCSICPTGKATWL